MRRGSSATRVGGPGVGVRLGQAVPGGMRDRDERAGIEAAFREIWPGFACSGRREVGRQPDRQQMPEFANRGRRRMHFGPQNGGERIGPKRPRVDDREVVFAEKMIGQRQEIVAGLAVGLAYRFGCERTVGADGMGVEIALEKASGRRKGGIDRQAQSPESEGTVGVRSTAPC